MKVFICFMALAANVSGKDHIVISYKSNDTDSCNSCRRIDFISTNNNRLQWSCIHPSSSLSSSLILSSTTKQSPSMSLCKYDSNSLIYEKQQYHKRMEQVLHIILSPIFTLFFYHVIIETEKESAVIIFIIIYTTTF